jgi:hypothetical protein
MNMELRASALTCAALLLGLQACSSGNSGVTPQVGAITFTNVNGAAAAQPLQLMAEGESTYVLVDVANDPQLLGANWSVYCGSAVPPGTPLPPGQTQDQSCGSFSPVHTMSGPIPSYATSTSGYLALYTAPAAVPKQGNVTLYASSTTDPSQRSSATITIVGQYITVVLAPAPPGDLASGASTQVAAVVANDPNNSGVNWSLTCSALNCGAVSQAQTASGVATTYTAPANLQNAVTVQITASSVADPNRTASATVNVQVPQS